MSCTHLKPPSALHIIGIALLAVASCGDSSDTDAGGAADAGGNDASVDRDAGPQQDAGPGFDAGPSFDGGQDAGPMSDPGPRFIGRVDDSNPEAVRFGWPGTGVVIRFDGTAVRVRLADSGFLTVVVDGVVAPRIETSGDERTYDLATALPTGEHTVELYRRNEGFLGTTTLSAIEVDGELLAVPTPARFMEVIGDSISCGYGNEGADESCSFSADTENHYMTYAAIAARAAGAELSTVAWSGKGVVNNYGGDTVEPMPELYDRLIPTEAGDYSFERTADVVLINLGTNDFSTGDDPDGTFTGAYTEFLAHLRTRHPDAMILATIAPLLGGEDYTRAIGYVEDAVASRVGAGDAQVRVVDLRVDAIGWGCDYHPSIATHESMAERLTEVLGTELGW